MKANVINYHITEACNYRCKFCFAKFEKAHLNLEDAKKVIDSIDEYFKINNIKNGRINIAGGEPLLCTYLDEIIDYINTKNIDVSLITNASLLTEDNIAKWTGKVKIVGISIDAATEKTAISIGRCCNGITSSIERLNAISKALKNANIKLKINTVVNKLNLTDNMKEIYQMMKPDRLKFLCVHIVENKNLFAKSLKPTREEFDAFISKNYYEENCETVVEKYGSMENAYFMINPKGNVYLNDNGTEKEYGNCIETPLYKIYETLPINEEKFFERYE